MSIWAEWERKYPAGKPHHNWMEARTVTPEGTKLDPGEYRYHTARDITFPPGSRILSQLPGVVEYVGYIPNQYGDAFGWMVKIKNTDGSVYKYIHLEPVSVVVRKGQHVPTGGYLGITRTGNVGRSKSHLHLETIRGGKPVDPATAIMVPSFAVVGGGLLLFAAGIAIGYWVYQRTKKYL